MGSSRLASPWLEASFSPNPAIGVRSIAIDPTIDSANAKARIREKRTGTRIFDDPMRPDEGKGCLYARQVSCPVHDDDCLRPQVAHQTGSQACAASADADGADAAHPKRERPPAPATFPR